MEQNHNVETIQIVCRNRNSAQLLCIHKGCKQQAFICLKKHCACMHSHKHCTFTQIDSLFNKLFKRKQIPPKQVQKSFEFVEKIIDDLLDRISMLRQKLTLKRQAFGMCRNSTILYSYLTNQDLQVKVTGNFMQKVKQELQQSPEIYLMSSKIIQEQWARKKGRVDEIIKKLESLYEPVSVSSLQYKDRVQKRLEKQLFSKGEFGEKTNQQFLLVNGLIQISKIPNIKNIHIVHTDNYKSAELIKNPQLNHLTLGRHFINRDSINQTVLNEMIKLTQLKSLNFRGIKFESKSNFITQILNKNKNIQSLVISNYYQNQNITDQMIVQLGSNCSLRHLIIDFNSAITGRFLDKFQNLQILSLIECQYIKNNEFIIALKKMKKLTHLNLSYNQWVNDEVFLAITNNCTMLKFLNLMNTGLKGQNATNLKKLRNLEILSFGGWRQWIFDQLISVIQNIKNLKIRKLSIDQVRISNEQLLKIDANSRGITHLGIKGCQNISVETLLKMKKLKVVACQSNQNKKNQLNQAGIKVLT